MSDPAADGSAAPDESSAEPPATAESAPAAASTAPPPLQASELLYATLWYYEDMAGCQQGPFASADMRTWFTCQYLPPSTRVAPTWYGEVPEVMWPISDLWDAPDEAAFQVAEEAAVAATAVRSDPEFIPADTFEGAKAGYIFKNDHYGIGYYRDAPAEVEVTADSLLDEEQKLKKQRLEKAAAARPLPRSPSRN